LDYVLSKRGQTVLANQSELYSLREDVASPQTAAELNKLRPGKLRPIPVSDALLEHLDQKQRLEFFKRWKSLAK
jgi:iron(III) transport system substrate-binding protein